MSSLHLPMGGEHDMITIILVEDDEVARLVGAETLHRCGIRVIGCSDSASLPQLVARERPDLVLLDLSLPGESGFDACRRLKSTPGLVDTRVVILSASRGFDDVRAALECGAERFLVKPLKAETVLHILKAAPQSAAKGA